MKTIISIAVIALFVGCDARVQGPNDKVVGESNEKGFRTAHDLTSEPDLMVRSDEFVTESISIDLAKQIAKSLVQFAETDGYSDGFDRIEDVRFTWLNIAGVHTRRAQFENLFLFPRLDVAEEDRSWSSGVALKRGSKIAYQWKID